MSVESGVRLRRVFVGSILAVLAAAGVFGAIFWLARNTLLGQAEQRLQTAAASAKAHLGFRLDQTIETLRQLAAVRREEEEGKTGGLVDRADRVLPRTLRGVVEVDESGTIRSAFPTGTVIDLPKESVADLVRRTRGSLSTAWAQAAERVTGLEVLLVALPLSSGAPAAAADTGAVIGVVDLSELARNLSTDSLISSSGLVIVMRDRGVLLAAGGKAHLAVRRIDELLAGDELAEIRERLADGQAPKGSFVADWLGRRERLIVAAEPVGGVPGHWAVATMLPERAALEPGRGLFLVGGAGAVALTALAIAVALAWVRAENARRDALGQIDRIHRLGARADRDSHCRFLVDHCPTPLLLLRDLEIVELSRSAKERIAAAGRESIVGRRMTDLVVAAARAEAEQFITGASSGGGTSRRLRTTFELAGQRRLAVELSVAELGGEPDGPVYRCVGFRDLSSDSRSEAVLRILAASDPRALLLLDPTGEVTWVNKAFGERMGYVVDELRGRVPLALVMPEDRRRARVIFGAALRGESRKTVVRVQTVDGRTMLADLLAMPLDLHGEIFAVVMVGQESRPGPLAASSRDAQLGAVVANFGSAVAHRLSNDFQALLGLLERVRQEGMVAPYCEEMSALVTAATTELQKFLAIGRFGASGLRLLRLGALVERWYHRTAQRLPKSVRLTVRRSAPDDRIIGDALQLQLVLDLAVSAAVAELQQGGGAVEVSLDGGSGSSVVRLAVSDTGESLDVGDASSRDPGALFSSREATLAVAETVAQRHEGRCGSRRRAGIGNRIWLDLPLCQERTAHPAVAASPACGGAVLLADDEDVIRETLAAALRERGHEVVEAWDGGMVIDLVSREPGRFELVVLDLLMPLMGGREAYRRLRQIAPSLPVLVCTGYEPAGDEALRGAEAIIKPFSIDEFVRRVEETLGSRATPQGPDGTMKS